MESIELNQEHRTQQCSECGKEYEARYFTLFSTVVDISHGRCRPCIDNKLAEDIALGKAVRLDEQTTQRRLWRESCGIPLKFMNEDFATFDTNRPGNMKTVYDKCLTYAEGFPVDYRAFLKDKGKAYPSLMLVSTDVWGIGKTHLVCSIAHKILNRWQGETGYNPVHFVSEPELYRRIQATYNYTQEEKRYREHEDDIIKELIYKPLLILDDIGKEQRSDSKFIQRILFAIIDGRYKILRPMVMTTNLTNVALKNYLSGSRDDQAIFDRLIEMTGGTFHVLKGESYRRVKDEKD